MFGKFFRGLDSFRTLPAELTESSIAGGWMTLLAYLVMATLFFCELYDFVTPKTVTSVLMDQHQKQLIEIHFDIAMHKLPCSAADVVVWDTFREQPLPITSKMVTKTVLDHTGLESGTHEEDIAAKLVKHTEEHPEFDLDWDHTSQQFKDMHFADVLSYHDFTMINFYAEWCIHCKHFAPTWNETETTADRTKYRDGDGNEVVAKLLRINCVEFPAVCRDAGVRWYPTVRLYKRDRSFIPFKGERKKDVILEFLANTIRESHHITNKDHTIHEEGCRLEGAIQTLRVPGEFHIQAAANTVNLEPSMTNVSHTVNSLIFLDDGEQFVGFLDRFEHLVPREVIENAQPFIGNTYTVSSPHEAPQHYIQVVSTVFKFSGHEDVTIYQTSAQSHVKKENEKAAPQAKFSYTLSPMSVVVSQDRMPLYEFLTKISALIGGTYTVVSLVHGVVGSVSKRYKKRVGKLG